MISSQSPSRTGAGSMLASDPSTGHISQGGHSQMRDTRSLFGGSETANPFAIPADEDLFRLQDEQRAERQAAKAAAAQLSVIDKTTFASRQQALFTDDTVKAAFHETLQASKKVTPVDPDASLAAAAVAAVPRRVARENIKDLLAKKRETLLVQMSLDTKRAEIRKLQERARQREEALKRSEAMLEEDALRFDAFLKENDEKVQEAIKHADTEAKSKQDKVLEIKRLNGAIAAVKSELSKQQERLEECKRYKEFLDGVTPAEWFAAQAEKQEQRREQQLAAWRAECDALRQKREAAAAAKARAEAEFSNAATQQEAERAERAMKAAAAALKDAVRIKDPPEPQLEPPTADAVVALGDMFFTKPEQLLQVYSDLEESNLFLIQVCQEAEEAVEELRSQDVATREQLNSATASLQAQIAVLQAAMEASTAKAAALKARAEQGEVAQGRLCLATGAQGSSNASPGPAPAAPAAAASVGAQQEEGSSGTVNHVALEDLERAVAAAYQRCGFEPDASLSTLSMLTSIEVRLEECLAAVDVLPPAQVAEAEKARERERRQLARAQKSAAAAAEHEMRVARALERAAAPMFKKTGKPVMARSRPPQKKVVVEVRKDDAEEAELAAFLATDLL